MNSALLTALVCLVGGATAAAQASYQNYGAGCVGTGGQTRVCNSANTGATALENLFFTQTSEVAIEVKGGINAPLVLGFEILTQAPRGKVTVQGHIHFADSQGKPLTSPAASGSFVVDTAVAWSRVLFPKPLLVKPGQTFFLSWTDPRVPFSQICLWPVPVQSPKATSYHRTTSTTGAWNGPFTVHPWAWRVLCPGTASTPALANTGLPKLGTSFSVDLSGAKESSAAVLITGLSKTTWGVIPLPFDLKGLGAAGCSLLASYDFPFVAPTSATGSASLTLPVPATNSLNGLQLHQQWLVLDVPANALGFAFSNGGTATLGN